MTCHAAGSRKLLLHLPTGAGKTVIGALVIERLRSVAAGVRTLFIAHRTEILDQTAAVISAHLPGLAIGIEQGARRVDTDPDVTIASVQSLVRRMKRFNPLSFGLIICDECHRALAPSWQEVIRYFHDNRYGDALLLGMTATPRRTDGRSVTDLFDEVAFELSRAELQDLGFLTPMRYFGVQAELHLGEVRVSAGDFQVGSLSAVMNTEAVRALTLRAWKQHGADKKTLVFCAGVRHAHQLADDFSSVLGVRAAVVDAKTRDRDRLLQQFRGGEVQVLTNYGVLTEGFDDPAIQCVLMARPTTSPLVYTQCLGRGLRPAPGKDRCTVIDIVDRTSVRLQYGAAEMAGLPPRWRSKGRDPFREHRSVSAVRVTDPDAFLRIGRASSLEEVQDILMELPPDVVLAGLDGEPVPRYEPPSGRPAADDAAGAARELLGQARAPYRDVVVDDDTVTVRFADAEVDNERYAHLQWHLERLTARGVAYERPRHRRLQVTNPRALLRSMAGNRRVSEFRLDGAEGWVRAAISDLSPAEVDYLCREFERETGMQLQLGGQLGFGF